MLTPLYPPVHLFHRANLCWNYPSQNQCFQVNSLAIHHLLASTCINLFSDHHSIVSHRTTTTTVMASVDHHASWTTIHRIRITCPIVFFSKWPQRVDQVNHSGSTGILFQRPMVSGDPRSGPISVSSALFLHPFPTPWDRERERKRFLVIRSDHCFSPAQWEVIIVASYWSVSPLPFLVLQLKVKMGTSEHNWIFFV